MGGRRRINTQTLLSAYPLQSSWGSPLAEPSAKVQAHIVHKVKFLRGKENGEKGREWKKSGIGGSKRMVKTVAQGHTANKRKRWNLNPAVRLWSPCSDFATSCWEPRVAILLQTVWYSGCNTISSWGLWGTLIFRLLTGTPAVIRSSSYRKWSVWNSVL